VEGPEACPRQEEGSYAETGKIARTQMQEPKSPGAREEQMLRKLSKKFKK